VLACAAVWLLLLMVMMIFNAEHACGLSRHAPLKSAAPESRVLALLCWPPLLQRLKEVIDETATERERAVAARQQRTAAEAKKRERLKAAFLKRQAEALLQQRTAAQQGAAAEQQQQQQPEDGG